MNKSLYYFLLCFLGLTMVSCGKDDEGAGVGPQPDPNPDPPVVVPDDPKALYNGIVLPDQ